MNTSLLRGLAVLALLVLALPVTTQAQPYPLQLTMTILPPYSPLLSHWEDHPERIQLTVRNTGAGTHQFRLAGQLENSDRSIRMWTKLDAPAQPFTIGPNGTLTFSGWDYSLFNPNMVDGSGVDKDQVARTGRLPEGSYTICAWAVEFSTKEALSAPPPTGCTFIPIQYGEVPRPVFPVFTSQVTALSPQLVTLQWTTPVSGVPPAEFANLRYDLMLVPVPSGKTVEGALEAPGDPALFTRTGLVSTLFQYNAMQRQLLGKPHSEWVQIQSLIAPR